MMKKIVLTGAAGRLGSYLREPLAKMAETLVSTDIPTSKTTSASSIRAKASWPPISAISRLWRR